MFFWTGIISNIASKDACVPHERFLKDYELDFVRFLAEGNNIFDHEYFFAYFRFFAHFRNQKKKICAFCETKNTDSYMTFLRHSTYTAPRNCIFLSPSDTPPQAPLRRQTRSPTAPLCRPPPSAVQYTPRKGPAKALLISFLYRSHIVLI